MKLRSSKIPRADHSSSGPFRALLASAVLGGGLLAGGPAPSDGSGARAAESSVTGFERRPAGPGLLAFGFSGDLAAVGWDEPRPGTDATARVLIARDGAHANAPVSEWIDAPLVTTWIAHPPGSRLRVEGSWGDTTPVPWPADLRPDVRESIRSDLARPLLVGEPNWLRDVWATPVRFVPLVPDGAGGLAYAEQATFVARLENPGDIVAAASWPGGGESAAMSGAVARLARDPFARVYEGLLLAPESAPLALRSSGAERSAQGSGDSFASTDRPWIRLRVEKEDVYAVSGADLEAAGIVLSAVDPLTLRMFSPDHQAIPDWQSVALAPSWMDEVAIRVEDGGDGVFDRDDRVVWVGFGPDGWYRSYGAPETATERYVRDPFNETVCYWLTWGGAFESGPPRRMSEITSAASDGPFATTAVDRIHLEDDRVGDHWDPRPKENGVNWERFWWRSFSGTSSNNDFSQTLSVPSPVPSEPASVRMRLWGQNNPSSGLDPPPPDHHVRVSLNGNEVADARWDGITRHEISAAGAWLVPGPTQRFRFQIQTYVDSTVTARVDRILLAWAELEYTRSLVAPADTISFFAGGYSGPTEFAVSQLTRDDVVVFEADDVWNATRIDPVMVESGGSRDARFAIDVDPVRPARLLVRPDGALARPISIEVDDLPGPLLRARTAPVQMIVLTAAPFAPAAEALAAFRRTHFPGRESASVEVVDVQDVFDEFAFGRLDPAAIRHFLQFVRTHWTGGEPEDGPAYVVLVGDCHFDFRDVLREGVENYVPTFEAYHDFALFNSVYSPQFGSDDFYGYLDGQLDPALDLFIGRLPAQSLAEAEVMVEKTVAYELDSAHDAWRTRATLVADDRCQGTNLDLPLLFTHTAQTEELAVEILPPTVVADKIYLLEFGEECVYDKKPAAAEALRASMEAGTLLVNYTGHGSETQIADERVFELSGVSSLTNDDRLFLFVTASCSVGKYDHSTAGLGEALVRHPGGGAVAVFAASAVAFSNGNAELNRTFLLSAFPGRRASAALPLGEAAVIGKASLFNPLNVNSRRYVLLGDPAVALASPRGECRLELNRGEDPLGDTLPRGQRIRLAGEVVDTAGVLRADFDGIAFIEVRDSAFLQRREVTYNNGLYSVNYELPGAPIHRGEAEVSGGRFELDFFTPAALRNGPRGDAQLFVHATDGEVDAAYALPDLLVPESPAPPTDDVRGPELTLELVGDPEALDPGSEYRVTLADSSGINITGLVGSRSVVARIEQDGTLIQAADLSSRVRFGTDFRRGELHANLPAELTPGRRYELIVEASDNVNNRSSVARSFFLAGGGASGVGLAGVFVFPNPADGPARFFGQIDDEAEIEVLLFTASGRSIARVGPTRFSPDLFASTGLVWDGRDQDGDTLANGLYFFKLTARSVRGGQARSTIGRLAVSR